MASELFVPPSRALDPNADPYSGAKWFFYQTGTTTPQSVYTTSDLSVAHASPVVADAGGKFPNIYFDPLLQYRGVCKDSAEAVTLHDIDPVNSSFLSLISASSGSSLIGFLQSGTGAVARTAQDKMREIVSVTDFMGVLAVTAAIQAALNTGKHVYFPGGTYALTGPVTTSVAGQRLFGDGDATIITNSGTDSNANTIILAHTGCVALDMKITPGTTTNTLLGGWGVYVTASKCVVDRVHVTGMRRGGVALIDASNCAVVNCLFDASVVAANDPQSDGGYDIYAYGNSSYNVISNNRCISGVGVGIGCQTVVLGKSQFGNIITGNIIKDQPSYGVMGYLSNTADTVVAMTISGNLIDNISGTTYSNGTQLFYGAGIYIQSVDDFTISGNTITRTNTDRSLPRTGNDVPAAVAITCNDRVTGSIVGNTIRDAYYGVYAVGIAVTTGDGVTVTGNRIKGDPSGTRKLIGGIVVTNTPSAVISANSIFGSDTANTVRGIWVNNTNGVTMQDFAITGNIIHTANTPIEINKSAGSIDHAIVKGNTLRNSVNYACYSVAVHSHIEGNHIDTAATGIGLTSAVTQGHIVNNSFGGTVTTPVSDSSTGGARIRGNRYGAGSIQGTATLVAGTVTVNTTEITTGDVVLLSRTTAGGTLGDLSVGTITNGTSFVINSNNAADTSTIAWEIRH